GQVIYVAHGAKQAIHHKVGEGYKDGHGDAGERAAASHGKCEGNAQHRHHDGGERVGELVPQGHAEPLGVEAALAQVADVAPKLAEVHLLRLQALLLEVAGLLVNLGKGRVLEVV